jgi:hypothetical protein
MAKRYAKDMNLGPEPDSDGDGLTDSFERAVLGTDPNKRDTDGDGLSDLREKDFGSNPILYDTDLDGVSDGREVKIGTDPSFEDTDGDGVGDRAEIVAGTAHAPDMDRDGTADWVQSVRDADMDGDGLTDGEEQWLGTNILSDNSDGDDLNDLEETNFGGDLGRSPSVMDGKIEIRIPNGPDWVDPPPDLDMSPPDLMPQALVEEPTPDVTIAMNDSSTSDFANDVEVDAVEPAVDDAAGDVLA